MRIPSVSYPRAVQHRGQDTWRRATEWPLTIAAVVFLVAYGAQVVLEPRGGVSRAIDVLLWIIWAFFALDFAVRLATADRRGRWFLRHIPDFLAVVLPVLRPLRLLRLITLIGVLQRHAGARLRGSVALYAVSASVLLVVVSALAELDAERHAAGASIRTFGEALWWAAVTITTVGYGDYTPVTAEGRLIAVGVMIAGIAVLGTVTATLASWLVQRVTDADQGASGATRSDVRALSEQIARLTARLDEHGLLEPTDREAGRAGGVGPAQPGAARPSDEPDRPRDLPG